VRGNVATADVVPVINSKDLRQLHSVLPDHVARAQFLSDQGDVNSATHRVGPTPRNTKAGLSGELDAAVEAMKNVPWTVLQELKGDANVLKIHEAEALLLLLRKALS
jgi:ParB family transcriptional regulator, chromosome partitioning protein